MVAFYLDEDVPEDLAPLLNDRGHFATTTREEGRKGAPDYRQLWFAAECGWTLIAMNRKDYLMLHGAWLLWRMSGASVAIMQAFSCSLRYDGRNILLWQWPFIILSAMPRLFSQTAYMTGIT